MSDWEEYAKSKRHRHLSDAERYRILNTDYQTRVKFLSKDEQIKWHEENKELENK